MIRSTTTLSSLLPLALLLGVAILAGANIAVQPSQPAGASYVLNDSHFHFLSSHLALTGQATQLTPEPRLKLRNGNDERKFDAAR